MTKKNVLQVHAYAFTMGVAKIPWFCIQLIHFFPEPKY